MRFFAVLTMLFSSFAYAATDCAAENQKAAREAVGFYPAEVHSVAGKGRLFFYSAPNDTCKSANTFVVPGDELTVYADYGDWYLVIYFSLKSVGDTEGWVRKARLRYQGLVASKQ